MAKILAKIARRNNSNELPRRRELVEMDLFDTKRNPWPGKLGGGGLWKRYDFDPHVPFSPDVNGGSEDWQLVGPTDLVVERTSLALAFVGGIVDCTSGLDGSGNQSVSMRLSVRKFVPPSSHVYFLSAQTGTGMVSGGTFRLPSYNAFSLGVLEPGTYQVNLWVWKFTNLASELVVSFTEAAASIALLPAGLGANPILGGGV